MKLLSAKYCIIRISIFLALIAFLVFGIFGILKNAFCYNIYINSVILSSFLIGIIFVYNRVFTFNNEFEKLINGESLRKRVDLKLISPIVTYLDGSRVFPRNRVQIIISAIEKKVDDYCAFSKYISGSLIFLGLLGTFWGLSHTIGNVANIIDNLGINVSDATESFNTLKESLKIPLSGMGIAFGCSLFGLSGSLILGFLNINQKKVADDFLDKVEEHLVKKSITFSSEEEEQSYHGSGFSMALLEKTVETIYNFQAQLKEAEANRISVVNLQKDFSIKLSQLVEAVSKHQEIVRAIGENQLELQKNISSQKPAETVFVDMLNKLSTIDASLNSIIQGEFMNREYIVDNLGKEIRLISKTLSSLMRD